jgi:hypothetical protein
MKQNILAKAITSPKSDCFFYAQMHPEKLFFKNKMHFFSSFVTPF